MFTWENWKNSNEQIEEIINKNGQRKMKLGVMFVKTTNVSSSKHFRSKHKTLILVLAPLGGGTFCMF